MERTCGFRRLELVRAVKREPKGGARRRREAIGEDLVELGERAGVGDVELEGFFGFQRSEPELHDDRPLRSPVVGGDKKSTFPSLSRRPIDHRHRAHYKF